MGEFEGYSWVAQHTPLDRRRQKGDFALEAAPETAWVHQAAGTGAHRLSSAQGTRGGESRARGGAAQGLELR